MSAIAVRAGTIADVDAVMRIMETAFDPQYGEAWNRAQLLGILSLGDVWLTLATAPDAAQADGFALSRRTLDEAELLLLAVAPPARGAALGRALVEAVAREALARGAARLMLEMRDGNPARHLYAATCFQPVGRRRAYYRGRDGRMFDAVTLSRDLGASRAGTEGTALP